MLKNLKTQQGQSPARKRIISRNQLSLLRSGISALALAAAGLGVSTSAALAACGPVSAGTYTTTVTCDGTTAPISVVIESGATISPVAGAGVSVTSGTGAITVSNNGVVTTAPNGANGIYANGAGDVTVNTSGEIVMNGSRNTRGIHAESTGPGDVNVTMTGASDIKTRGQ